MTPHDFVCITWKSNLHPLTNRNHDVYQTWKRALAWISTEVGHFRSNKFKIVNMVWGHICHPPIIGSQTFAILKNAFTFSIVFWNFELIPNCTCLFYFCGQRSAEDDLRTKIKLRDINFKRIDKSPFHNYIAAPFSIANFHKFHLKDSAWYTNRHCNNKK